jgi:hypothetical protein
LPYRIQTRSAATASDEGMDKGMEACPFVQAWHAKNVQCGRQWMHSHYCCHNMNICQHRAMSDDHAGMRQAPSVAAMLEYRIGTRSNSNSKR